MFSGILFAIEKIYQVFCIGFKNYYLKYNLIQRSNHLDCLKIKTKRIQNKEKRQEYF